VLCSHTIDGDAPWDLIETEIDLAANRDRATLFHAHDPGRTVSRDTLEAVLDLADSHGLGYATFPELVPGGPRRAALALAFDDQWFDSWYGIRDLLAAHDARVTFFVSRFHLATETERAELAALHAAGHAVEAHTVEHLRAPDYVAAHGLDAYLADEVAPSLEILRAAGYTPTSFAFPFGASTDELNAAVLQLVDRVRVSPRSCPN
jgi:peptidoglycan/xylan/chitin deacetylase (PgdA/CDA1 family)